MAWFWSGAKPSFKPTIFCLDRCPWPALCKPFECYDISTEYTPLSCDFPWFSFYTTAVEKLLFIIHIDPFHVCGHPPSTSQRTLLSDLADTIDNRTTAAAKLAMPTGRPTMIQYIPRNMHTIFALLCFVVVIHWLIFPYPSGLLHWHCGNLTIAPVPAKQPWWIWINTSCEFIMNDCITATKHSTTKLCAYFLGYTVGAHGGYLLDEEIEVVILFT